MDTHVPQDALDVVCYARVFFDYRTKGKHTVNVLHWTREKWCFQDLHYLVHCP